MKKKIKKKIYMLVQRDCTSINKEKNTTICQQIQIVRNKTIAKSSLLYWQALACLGQIFSHEFMKKTFKSTSANFSLSAVCGDVNLPLLPFWQLWNKIGGFEERPQAAAIWNKTINF